MANAIALLGHYFGVSMRSQLQALFVLAWATSALDIPWDAARVALLLLTVAGVAFLGLSFGVWSIGVRRYTSTGS